MRAVDPSTCPVCRFGIDQAARERASLEVRTFTLHRPETERRTIMFLHPSCVDALMARIGVAQDGDGVAAIDRPAPRPAASEKGRKR